MREENLTLQRAIDICRANEASESQIKNIVDEKAVNHVIAQGAHGGIKRDRGNSRHNNRPTHDSDKSRKRQGKCKYCGSSHARGNCPAYGKKCRKCGKSNHFQKVCKSRGDRVHMLQEESDSDADGESLSSEEFLAYGIETTDNGLDQDCMVQVKSNNIPIKFKIDTGAQCNVITEKLCKEAGIKDISKSKSRLVS